jgi:hypothetical protein
MSAASATEPLISATASIPTKAIRIAFLLVVIAKRSLLKDGVASAPPMALAIHLFARPETQSCGNSFPSSRSLDDVSSYFLL